MKTRQGYTLIELLTVIAIASLLIPIGGRLFTDAWQASHRATRQAENNQLVSIIMKRWQQEFRDTASDKWKMENGGLQAESLSVRAEENHLVFDDDVSTKKIFLPYGTGCSLSIERHESSADCAVLTLNVRSCYYSSIRTNSIRIVACGKGTQMQAGSVNRRVR